MLEVAMNALDAAMAPGVSYGDVRVIESKDRNLSTKNGHPGSVSSAESIGAGIRLIADGCWGFAATDDLSPTGIHAAAALAVSIARASAMAKKRDVSLAPEDKYESTWSSECRIDPFSMPVDEQLAYLLKVDGELRG